MDSVKLYLIEEHEAKISKMEQKIKDLESKVIESDKTKELENKIVELEKVIARKNEINSILSIINNNTKTVAICSITILVIFGISYPGTTKIVIEQIE